MLERGLRRGESVTALLSRNPTSRRNRVDPCCARKSGGSGLGPAIVFAIVPDDEAMATSGAYERGEHIWGPGSDVASVSVIGPDLGTADAITTALFSSSDDTWLERFPGYESITIMADRRILTSPGVSQSSDGLLRVA